MNKICLQGHRARKMSLKGNGLYRINLIVVEGLDLDPQQERWSSARGVDDKGGDASQPGTAGGWGVDGGERDAGSWCRTETPGSEGLS